MKTFLGWVVCLGLFCTVSYFVQMHEQSQEDICSEKGMVIVRPIQDKPYCVVGSRVGL